jgi:hypothetical protein
MRTANGYEDLGVECALPRGYAPARRAGSPTVRRVVRWLVALAAVALTLLLAWPDAGAWTGMLANLGHALTRS